MLGSGELGSGGWGLGWGGWMGRSRGLEGWVRRVGVLDRDTILLPTLSRTPTSLFFNPNPTPFPHFSPIPSTFSHTPNTLSHTYSPILSHTPHPFSQPNTLSTSLPTSYTHFSTPQTHFHTPTSYTPHLPILSHILCPHPSTLSTPLPTPQTYFHTPTPHTPHQSILSHTPNTSFTPSLTSLPQHISPLP